jgi:hypothetical protein
MAGAAGGTAAADGTEPSSPGGANTNTAPLASVATNSASSVLDMARI